MNKRQDVNGESVDFVVEILLVGFNLVLGLFELLEVVGFKRESRRAALAFLKVGILHGEKTS